MIPGIVAPAGGTTHNYSTNTQIAGDPFTNDTGLVVDIVVAQKIPPNFLPNGGAYMRLTLWSPHVDTTGTILDSVWVGTGNIGFGNIYNFAAVADQVQVSFSNYGFADATKPTITAEKDFISDDIHFAFDNSKPLIIAFGRRTGQVFCATKDTAGVTLPSTLIAYVGGAYTEAGTTSKTTAYKSKSSRVYLVKTIEVSSS